ncbi:hypothetical protein NM688_g7056 [Phlebia brevispora]|uniref:Uncharacterized protein n=1 Tax=Phlebia brevispora TaxID=194682 RepID=A0ACC1S9K0_9APHY|nr:hypothetical protein NM688_g7056 [Phlebia brevispora]
MITVHNQGDPAVVFLRPRPFAKCSGRLVLLPLLPYKTPPKPLPSEVWTKVFGYLFDEYRVTSDCQNKSGLVASRTSLLLICKNLTDIALPIFYEHVHIYLVSALERFTQRLYVAEQNWDSLRRIPYSTPGRWVQTLDLSDLQCSLWVEVCHIDNLLTRLFPLLPFVSNITLNPSITLSQRVFDCLCGRDGNNRLRYLKGLKLNSPFCALDERLVDLLRYCPNLVELECSGPGLEGPPPDLTQEAEVEFDGAARTLYLPRLQKVIMISMFSSPVMLALLHSPLPNLTHLTVTPYDDISIPTSLVPKLIEKHGPVLTSLHLYAPKTWPTMLFPSPTTLLHTCPKLRHLSLENPLPTLTICSIYPKHPLQILSIPRPDPDFLTVLESLLPKLPALKAVRSRDVRWLRAGMGAIAREAGVQGEMHDWKRRLGRRGIHILDADWQRSLN